MNKNTILSRNKPMRPLAPALMLTIPSPVTGMTLQTTPTSTADMGPNPNLATVASTLAGLINRLAVTGPGVAVQ